MAGSSTSEIAKNRARIQELLNDNTTRAGGDFHSDELDEESFILALKKKFEIRARDGEDGYEHMNELIKSCTHRIRGRIKAKELKQGKFIKKLFDNFEIKEL